MMQAWGSRRKVGGWGLGAALAAAIVTVPLAAQKTAIPSADTTRVAVRGIARAPLPKGERITVEFTGEVSYTSDRVDNPDRVYFDFAQSSVAPAATAAAQALGAGPLVRSVRIARHTGRTTRLVLELSGRPRYSAFVIYNPYRLVIDVESDAPLPAPPPPPVATDTTVRAVPSPAPPLVLSESSSVSEIDPPPAAARPAAATAAPSGRERTKPDPLISLPPASATARGEYSLSRQLGLGVSRIVIDAGHGGHDPGAQSNGINESELVLDVALRVEQLLAEQPGIDVTLTRRSDEFIPLEERTAIANREGADLFLSIHANASRQASARGIETYFLNFATNPAAEAVAARENATSSRTMGNLPELVKTIALNNKVKESHELATMVQTSMARRLRQQNKSLRDLGVKQAPFVVLIGAQMPSVLAEISFLTNKPEASLLKQASYRQRIAQALADAVLKYQGSLKNVTTVAVRDGRQ